MTTDLIKLLVNIEESAQKLSATSHTSPQKKIWHSKEMVSLTQKSSFQSKEKQQRRTLRSKITKILQTLPHHCEKEEQKSYSSKWAAQKKRFYEVNRQRKLNGKDPLAKLNLSSDSSSNDPGCYSAREALLQKLNENELLLLNDDPMYFIPDKKLFKSNEGSNWDLLLKNDPKDLENKKKKEKFKDIKIDFLKGPEDYGKQKNSKKKIEFRNTQKIFVKKLKKSKPATTAVPFRIGFERRERGQLQTVKSLPSLERDSQKKLEVQSGVRSAKRSSEDKEFKQFLKASYAFEQQLKYSIAKQATDSKLTGVKLLLQKWESKKRVSPR